MLYPTLVDRYAWGCFEMHMWMLEDCNITEIIKILFSNERTIEQMPTGFRCQCLGYSALCILWLLWFQNFKSRRFSCVMWAHFLGEVHSTVIQQYVFGPIIFLRKWFPCSACSLGPNLFFVFMSTLTFIMVLTNRTESCSRPLLCRFCKESLHVSEEGQRSL